MTDLWDKSLSFHVAVLVGLYWTIMFAMPFMIANPDFELDAPASYCFAALIGYCGYTGFRAWRRGWKSRFILRVVVPAALFLTASIIVAAIRWL